MSVPEKIREKLRTLPDKPGVYFMRDRQGRIIYVGKATSLRDRVRSYFHQATLRSADPKLRGLLHSVADLEYLVVRTEAEAVITEGRMIKDYRPRYNVQFKDDKRFILLKVNLNDEMPRFDVARLRKNDGATYFGPYASSQAARAALEFLDRRFGLRRCGMKVAGLEEHKHCMNDIVRYCSAPCTGKVSREEYMHRVHEACAFLRGERKEYLEELRRAMEKEAAEMNFEKAAALRDMYLLLGRALKERYSGRKSLELKIEDARAGVEELQKTLHLREKPRVIEAYDISNISGTHAVGSLVCAVDGMPHRNRYRMFRIRTIEGSDDPGMMAEVIRRRFTRAKEEKTPLPDLVLVDGGPTQLAAARRELEALGLGHVATAGLAKRFEEVYWDSAGSEPLRLPLDSPALKVLQRIRDEAHRFALTYHRTLRMKRIRDSVLDDIEGIGEKRKTLLLQHFGSVARLRRASPEEIAEVPGIGPVFAAMLSAALGKPAGSQNKPAESDGNEG